MLMLMLEVGVAMTVSGEVVGAISTLGCEAGRFVGVKPRLRLGGTMTRMAAKENW